MHTHPTAAYNFFLLLLLAVSIVVFLIFKPFISPLILAAAFAVIFHPLYRSIGHNITGGRKTWAALLTLLIVIALIIVPLLFVGGLMFNEAKDLYISLGANEDGVGVITTGLNRLEATLQNIAPDITLDIRGYTEAALAWVLGNLSSFFSGFAHIVINLFIMLITLFFLLRDGDRLRHYIIHASPLANADDEGLLKRVENSINSVVKGSIVVAVVQGIVATAGYLIFDLPNPIIWGTVTAIASLIPGIGTAIVLIPAIIYLFFASTAGMAIGLLIWGVIAVGLIDNILAPYLINRGTKVHELLILISVLGGIAFFGPIGFIVGPVVMSLFQALLEMYPRLSRPPHDYHHEQQIQ